jgi:F420H(2)-dependent quinone reductase
MTGNDFMSWVLRSPFHGVLSNEMMLITVTGRKTGKKITLPVGYYCEDGYLWIITNRNRTWWRNLRDGAQVDLLLKRKLIKAFAETDLDEKCVEARMVEYLQRVPQAAKRMKIRMEAGKPNLADICTTAKDRLFVKIKI